MYIYICKYIYTYRDSMSVDMYIYTAYCPLPITFVAYRLCMCSTRYAQYTQYIDKYWTAFWSPIGSI